MPPNWKGPTGPGVRSRARSASAERASADPSAELSQMRSSFEDVCKERDVLKAHIAKMEALIHDRVGAQLRSAPPRTTSSAPTTPKGSRSDLSADGRSGSASRRRLSKKAEDEMVGRLLSKSWRPDRKSALSGVEQLKRRLDARDHKVSAAAGFLTPRSLLRLRLAHPTDEGFRLLRGVRSNPDSHSCPRTPSPSAGYTRVATSWRRSFGSCSSATRAHARASRRTWTRSERSRRRPSHRSRRRRRPFSAKCGFSSFRCPFGSRRACRRTHPTGRGPRGLRAPHGSATRIR